MVLEKVFLSNKKRIQRYKCVTLSFLASGDFCHLLNLCKHRVHIRTISIKFKDFKKDSLMDFQGLQVYEKYFTS